MHLELVKEKQWFWRLIADNGQTVLTSETYASKASAQRTALKFAARNSYELKVLPVPDAPPPDEPAPTPA